MCSSSGRLSFGWDVKSYVVRCVSPLTKWQHSTCRHVAVLRRHWRQQFRPRPPRLDSSCGVVPLQWSLQFDDTRSYSVSVLAVSVRQYGIPKPNPIEYRQYCTTKKITTLYIMQFACDIIQYIYTVFKKTVQNYFGQKFVKFLPTAEMFGTKIAERISLCEVHSFSNSPNLCQRTTVLNADVPNSCITL